MVTHKDDQHETSKNTSSKQREVEASRLIPSHKHFVLAFKKKKKQTLSQAKMKSDCTQSAFTPTGVCWGEHQHA